MTSEQCCDSGTFAVAHTCQKQPSEQTLTNGAGIPLTKLNRSPGHAKGARNLHAKHPSSIAKRLKAAGVDWCQDLAKAIRDNNKERIAMWLKLLPYLITTTNKTSVRKWRGKASKAALVALDALEGK
jgi:hypothetical protein